MGRGGPRVGSPGGRLTDACATGAPEGGVMGGGARSSLLKQCVDCVSLICIG